MDVRVSLSEGHWVAERSAEGGGGGLTLIAFPDDCLFFFEGILR